MLLLSLIYVALACIILAVSKKIFKDLFSPVAIMGFVWMMVFALYQLRLYPYNDLEMETWMHFFSGLGMFFIGCFLASLIVGAMSKTALSKSRKFHIAEKKLFKITIAFWLIGSVGFCILFFRVVYLYGFNAFLHSPQVIHDDFTMRFIGYLWILNVITPTLSAIYFMVTKKKMLFMCVIFCTSLLWLMFSISRSNDIRALFLVMLSLSYLKLLKHEMRSLIIVGLCSVIFFSLFSYIKDPGYAERLKRNSFEPKILRNFAGAYGYFTTPMTVYEKMRKDVKEYEYGINTFVTEIKMMNLLGMHFKLHVTTEQKYYRNPIRCNVYTFLDAYYKDFGFPGIVILCFLQGVLVMFFYLKMIWLNQYHLFFLNATFGWCLFISFFSNHFRGNTSLFLIMVTYAIGRYIIDYDYPEGFIGVSPSLTQRDGIRDG